MCGILPCLDEFIALVAYTGKEKWFKNNCFYLKKLEKEKQIKKLHRKK